MTQVAIENKSVWFTRTPAPEDWVPFEWDEPMNGGTSVAGEIAVARAAGTMGTLTAGLWRVRSGGPNCQPDGSGKWNYSSPLGDETLVVLEGEATITIVETGEQHRLTPGTIVSHPKNLQVLWETKPPFFKKYWVISDGPKAATPSKQLFVGNINDNPEEWTPYSWTEPAEGPQECGELFLVRETGSTGTLLLGIWRSGVGIHGCNPDGSAVKPYTAPLGDETILLLEGEVHIRDDESGEEYDCRSGDVIGLSSGRHITWTSKGPFVKKFFVITNEDLPAG